jgi:hypothetical protein
MNILLLEAKKLAEAYSLLYTQLLPAPGYDFLSQLSEVGLILFYIKCQHYNAKTKEARDPCLGWATFTLPFAFALHSQKQRRQRKSAPLLPLRCYSQKQRKAQGQKATQRQKD